MALRQHRAQHTVYPHWAAELTENVENVETMYLIKKQIQIEMNKVRAKSCVSFSLGYPTHTHKLQNICAEKMFFSWNFVVCSYFCVRFCVDFISFFVTAYFLS